MKSAQELAAALGVNEATLRLWRAEAGIPAKARGNLYTADEEARIREIAANKRKSKPRKGDSAQQDSANYIAHIESALEVPVMRAVSQKYSDMIRDMNNDTTAQSTPSDFDYTRIEGMYTAQLERIERNQEEIKSQLDALTALLERAAIAPRYVKREAVEEALDERPKRAYTKREPRPVRANGKRLGYFAGLHGVNERTARDQANRQDTFTVTVVPINSHQEYYVAPEQEAAIIAFWQRTGYPYTKCPECPHTQEVQE